jgi:hypothetical protein
MIVNGNAYKNITKPNQYKLASIGKISTCVVFDEIKELEEL